MVVGIATVVLIIGLLLVIYRSPVAAFLPILTVGLVAAIAPGLIALAAKAFDLQVTQDLQTILTVVLYGVGTDYILFLLFRYRERLRAGEQPKEALVNATARVAEVIVSAAGAIIVAFSALLLAVFGGFKSLGPGLAIAVAVMAFAAITLIPAVVSLLGPKVFWPSKSWQKTPKGAMFKRVRPVHRAAPGRGRPGLRRRDGRARPRHARDEGRLRRVQPAPATAPSRPRDQGSAGRLPCRRAQPDHGLRPQYRRYGADPAELTTYAGKLAKVDGVGAVLPAAADGSLALLNADKTVAQINVVLNDPPYATSSLDLVDGKLRDAAHADAPAGTTALLGGVTASYTDIRDANSRDLSVIFPVAGGLIAIILALLLRSLLAPIVLMVAVVLSFFSSIGATVFVFQGAAGQRGDVLAADHAVPVRRCHRHRLQHPDDRAVAGGGRAGTEPREAADLAIEHGGPSVRRPG